MVKLIDKTVSEFHCLWEKRFVSVKMKKLEEIDKK